MANLAVSSADLMELNGWTSPQMLTATAPAPAAPAPAAATTASWTTAPDPGHNGIPQHPRGHSGRPTSRNCAGNAAKAGPARTPPPPKTSPGGRTFIAHAGTVPGGGSPANQALPDARRRPQTETKAITQGHLPHNTESPTCSADRRLGCLAVIGTGRSSRTQINHFVRETLHCSRFVTSRRRMVPSWLAVTRIVPSGLNAPAST